MKRAWVIALVAACTHAHEPGPSGQPDAGGVTCGDGTCNAGETLAECPEDCARCGDLVCSPNESAATCPADCALCGDGLCNHGETLADCPADCSTCGDGMCTGAEDLASCAADCSQCGDGVCTGSETVSSCAQDCGASLHIANQSSYTVYSLNAWACGTSNEGINLLGAITIVPNGSFDLHGIPPGCFELRAATANSVESWTRASTQFVAGQTFTWSLFN